MADEWPLVITILIMPLMQRTFYHTVLSTTTVFEVGRVPVGEGAFALVGPSPWNSVQTDPS